MARLLVIEDEAPLLQTILNTLQFAGFETIGARDGTSGVELAHTYQPDLVISDIRMPEMDGYGVLQALRSHPDTADVPLIFLTAKANREDMRYGMNLGADDYISKPFTYEELVTAIETRLARQERYNKLQQRMAQVAKSEQLKGDMILIAAHDLRNPITSIRVALHVLKRKLGTGDQVVDLPEINSIATAAARMESITTDILSLERIEAAARDDTLQTVNLSDLVEACCADFHDQISAKGLILDNALPALNPFVLGDPVQLREAIHNLLSNAVKYTPAGGQVHVRLDIVGQKCLLGVEDTGFGIPASQLNRLYEPFHRVKTPETQTVEGTGLGLHLVKNIVMRHQGQVFVESVYGEGSVFGFFLPLHEVSERSPQQDSASSKPVVARGLIHRLIAHIAKI